MDVPFKIYAVVVMLLMSSVITSSLALSSTLRRTTLAISHGVKARGQLFSTVSDRKSEVEGQLSSAVYILGAGPTGLATSIMLARRGYTDVRVLERLSEPPAPSSAIWTTGERSYNIGISGRGQRTLNALNVMERVERYASDVVGRKDWAPGQEVDKPRTMVYTEKSYVTKCIQRDLLAAALLEEIRERYCDKVTVSFDHEVTEVTMKDDGECFLDVVSKLDNEKSTVRANFLIGADGAPSALRNSMETDNDGFFVKRYEDKNIRLYRTIPLHFPPNSKKKWRGDLNYSARTNSDINIDALPTKNGPYLGVCLYRPWDERMKNMKTAEDAKKFFDDVLPMFSEVVREKDLAAFASKGDSRLPRFMYAGPHLHKKRSVLLGDAIHTVKPYFGLGVNTAFEDVLALDRALDKAEDNVDVALADFSKERAKEARAMVQISHRLDGGFLTFVLPLIIDNILHKAVPWLFSPNTLTSLQNEKLTFCQVRTRKRIDRLLQVLLGVSSLVTGVVFSRAAATFVNNLLRKAITVV